MSTATLTKQEVIDLSAKCWRSRVEFCRVFLPNWFPSKMPWVHRGILALRTGRADFLLDFGQEWWPQDIRRGAPSEWTPSELVKIVTNFVIEVTPAKVEGGVVTVPAKLEPLFELDTDAEGRITDCRLRYPGSNYNAYMLPRGFSKTTLLNAANLADVCYAEAPFVVYVSETGPHAERQLASIRMQLENNDLLRTVFGNLVPDRQSTLKWTDPLIETTNGQRVGAIGSGGQIRGMVKDAIRPSRVVVDDFQDSEGVKSPTQRTKDMDWFLATLLQAGIEFADEDAEAGTTFDMVGTLLHPEAVLAQVMQDESWTRVRFGAYDRQGQPLWAYRMNEEAIQKKKEQFAKLGRLDLFDYEYMSTVPQASGTDMRVDKIIYLNQPDNWFVAKALVCDPAISDDPKADFCSFAVVGIGNVGKIHVVDFYAQVGMDPKDQVDKFFELHFAHLAGLPPDQQKHGVEAIAYQRALVSMITNEQHERSKTWGPRAYFEVIPIMHGKTGKMVRVQGILSPRLRAGHISMERHFPILETQMREWPKGKKDGPDAVAMAIQLLDPYVSLSANDNPDTPLAETMAGIKLPPLSKVFNGRSMRHAP